MSFSFGTTPASTTASKPSGFSFGTPSSAGGTPGFGAGFGSTTTAAPTSTGFGGFGSAASTSFGTSTSGAFGSGGFKGNTTSSSFGGFGAPSSLGSSTTTSTSGLAFGSLNNKPFCATSTATATKPFSLGTPSTGLGGAKMTGNAFGAPPVQPPATNLGLGGTTNSTSGGSNESNKSDIKALKETQIPNEILSTVDEFKKLVKEERNISSDIAHISSRIHDKIKSETEALGRLVSILSSGIKKNKAALDKLKLEAAQELRNAEIAQRTKDTPGALQYENVAPYEYFSRLVSNFENDMLKYRQQIDETEQHLQASASSAALSPEDLSKAIRKIHEAFTSLAGRYQHIHDCIQEQKSLFVKLHRQIYGVSTDLFDVNRPRPSVRTSAGVSSMEGPSPFILGHRDPFTAVRANLTAQPQQSSLTGGGAQPGGPPTMGLGASSSFGMGSNMGSQFGQSTMFSGFSSTTPSLGQTQGLLGSTISPFMNANKDKKLCFC